MRLLLRMQTILLVEDNIDIQNLVGSLLKPMADLTTVSSIAGALDLIDKKKFDLILLDLMLDDGDGFILASHLKKTSNGKDVPVIFLTAKGETADKVTAFRMGAEDYIVKPFDLAEFKARIESRLLKIRAAREKQDSVEKGNLRLEASIQKARLINENQNLELTPLQFKILFFLANHEGEVVTRDKLSTMIWGEASDVGRSIDTHVTSLRKKLGPYSKYVKSVYGAGYTFQSH